MKLSLTEENSGGRYENSAQNAMTEPTKNSFIKYKIKDTDARKVMRYIILYMMKHRQNKLENIKTEQIFM